MIFNKFLSVYLISWCLLSGCAFLSSDNTVVDKSPLPNIYNNFQPKIIWKYPVGSGFDNFYSNLHPAWQKFCIFAADRYGVVKAIDIESGKEIWSTNLSIHNLLLANSSAKLSGGLAVDNSKIYIGSELAKVYAIDIKNGSLSWESNVAGEAISTPVVIDNIVLIHTSNGMLQALNNANGVVKWSIRFNVPYLTLRGESSPTTAFGAAIIGSDNGWINAVMLKNGKIIWQQRISQFSGASEVARINDVQTTPVINNGLVYAIAYNGDFTALDLYSGHIIWKRKIGSITKLLINRENIYLVDQDDRILALDTKYGNIIWCNNELLHRNLTSPVLYNNCIITGDYKGYLNWINIYNGNLVAQQKINSAGLLSDPIVAGDKLVIQAIDGMVYAITR